MAEVIDCLHPAARLLCKLKLELLELLLLVLRWDQLKHLVLSFLESRQLRLAPRSLQLAQRQLGVSLAIDLSLQVLQRVDCSYSSKSWPREVGGEALRSASGIWCPVLESIRLPVGTKIDGLFVNLHLEMMTAVIYSAHRVDVDLRVVAARRAVAIGLGAIDEP